MSQEFVGTIVFWAGLVAIGLGILLVVAGIVITNTANL